MPKETRCKECGAVVPAYYFIESAEICYDCKINSGLPELDDLDAAPPYIDEIPIPYPELTGKAAIRDAQEFYKNHVRPKKKRHSRK